MSSVYLASTFVSDFDSNVEILDGWPVSGIQIFQIFPRSVFSCLLFLVPSSLPEQVEHAT